MTDRYAHVWKGKKKGNGGKCEKKEIRELMDDKFDQSSKFKKHILKIQDYKDLFFLV